MSGLDINFEYKLVKLFQDRYPSGGGKGVWPKKASLDTVATLSMCQTTIDLNKHFFGERGHLAVN